jgi:hypothetical protein
MNILPRYSVKTLNFFQITGEPDLLLIVLIMFAFIAVIVKGETRYASYQLSAVSHQQKQELIKIGALTLELLC